MTPTHSHTHSHTHTKHTQVYIHPRTNSGNLVEEQRALATLGRTYFVQSQSEFDQCGRNSKEIMTKATTEYLCSLDVCDKLIGHISDRELLEMKSRLYLNLGLVYESQGDTRNARKFMEKALGIVKYVCTCMANALSFNPV